MRIGVLALQGGFALHARALVALGHEVLEVRTPEAFHALDGLVLPGGESTTQLRLMARHAVRPAIEHLAASGKPVLATCAGLILAAKEVIDPEQESLGLLDVKVARNAWGRQLDSFEGTADETGVPLVFIRAPRIVSHAPSVDVLAALNGEPVLIRQRNVTGATFHPELTQSFEVHRQVFG